MSREEVIGSYSPSVEGKPVRLDRLTGISLQLLRRELSRDSRLERQDCCSAADSIISEYLGSASEDYDLLL